MKRNLGTTTTRVLVAGACGAMLTLTGCASTQTPAVANAASSVVSDQVTCEAFGDVQTVMANADAGLAEQRMAAQERDGWYRLATRVLDRIPTSGSGAVHDAITELQDAAPAVTPGAIVNTGIGSPEWDLGFTSLTEACRAGGYEWSIEMYTGG